VAIFELVIALLFAGALLASVARRLRAPYPALLAVAGAVLALLPRTPSVTLDPQLALALFVAPVLLDAAFDSSPRDLRENWRVVTSLALVAVGLTVAAVAMVARLLVPGLPWASAVALGAIVAPPDAAAASAVLRQLRPPHRLLVILEGESLFNDASALLIYRLALVAAAGPFSAWHALPILAASTLGSLALGAALAWVVPRLLSPIEDVATTVLVQFLSAFAVWLLAERLHLSGIITMVVFAIMVARRAPAVTPARLRVPSYAVWEVAVFVLNVLAFILVGLQLKPILASLSRHQLLDYLGTAAAVCAAVIAVRFAWVMGYALLGPWLGNWGRRMPHSRSAPRLKAATAVAWCGMRGIVTLAAALALPVDFPHRGLVLFVSFSVVLTTLVLQGGTLSPLMRWLRLQDDGTVEREVRHARAELARAGLAALDEDQLPEGLTRALRDKYQTHLRRAESAAGGGPMPDDGIPAYLAALRRAQSAERRALVQLRAQEKIGDDAFHRVEEELDWAELNTEAMSRRE
jgi:Na+/H+ antiporter